MTLVERLRDRVEYQKVGYEHDLMVEAYLRIEDITKSLDVNTIEFFKVSSKVKEQAQRIEDLERLGDELFKITCRSVPGDKCGNDLVIRIVDIYECVGKLRSDPMTDSEIAEQLQGYLKRKELYTQDT
jgi:hypothetical protein